MIILQTTKQSKTFLSSLQKKSQHSIQILKFKQQPSS